MVPYAPSWYSRQNYFWLRNLLQSRWIATIGPSCWNSMVLPLFLPSWSSWIGRRVEWPFVIFFVFVLIFNFIFLLYNIVLVLPYINMHLPWVYMCSPSRTPSPLPPIPSLWVIPVHQPQASCILYRTWTGNSFLKWYYTCFNAILPNHPPLPHPESKRLFYTSVSLLLSRIEGCHYHLSKFHIYALVYCIGVFLFGLLHSATRSCLHTVHLLLFSPILKAVFPPYL